MDEESVDGAESEDGFSGFLRAVASAPPPDRAFAPSSVVGETFRISRPLFDAGDALYLASSPHGDVCLVRRPGADEGAHARLLEAWTNEEGEGAVRVLQCFRVEADLVLACVPVPVGTAAAWLRSGPHPREEVGRRLGPLAWSLARAHARGVSGFRIDAEHLWIGLDGRLRLAPPRPGGSPAQDRAQLRALVAAATADAPSPAALAEDRRGDPDPSATLARALTRPRRPRWPLVVVLVALAGVGAVLATRGEAAPAGSSVPEPEPLSARRELWTRAANRVDADARALDMVAQLEDAGMPAHAQLLRARLAGRAQDWQDAVERAWSLPADDLRAEIALAKAEVALSRGSLLEAQRWLARSRELLGTGDAQPRSMPRVTWALQARLDPGELDLSAIRRAIEQASAPSLERAHLQGVLAKALAMDGQSARAREQYQTVLDDLRGDLARLRLEYRLATAHLLAARGELDEAAMVLDGLERDASTRHERGGVWLGRAMVERLRGDAEAADAALDRAEEALQGAQPCVARIDLDFERAAWLLHEEAFGPAQVRLADALGRHDALRGPDAPSRRPLERAHARAQAWDARLMTSAPPSRASAEP